MELNSADVAKVVRMIPREVRKVLLDGECVLAGGFIRDAIAGSEINDIDLFPLYPALTAEDMVRASDAIRAARPENTEPRPGEAWAVSPTGRMSQMYVNASIGDWRWYEDYCDARDPEGRVLPVPLNRIPEGWTRVDGSFYGGARWGLARPTQPRSASEWFERNSSGSTYATVSLDTSPIPERIANKIAFPYEAEPSAHAFNIKGLKYPVQVIRMGKFTSAQEVLDSFDFTMCRAAIWRDSGAGSPWKSLCHDTFYQDLSAKRLVYCSPKEEVLGSSLNRLLKFYGKGFTAPNETIAQIVARIAKKPDESHEAVAQQVNQALRNVYGTVSSEPEICEVTGEAPVQTSQPYWIDPVRANVAVAQAVVEASNAIEQRQGMSSIFGGRREETTPSNITPPASLTPTPRVRGATLSWSVDPPVPNRPTRGLSIQLSQEDYERMSTSYQYLPAVSVGGMPTGVANSGMTLRATPSGIVATEATSAASEQQTIAVVPSTGQEAVVQQPGQSPPTESETQHRINQWYESLRSAPGNDQLPDTREGFYNLPYHLRSQAYTNQTNHIGRTPSSDEPF